MADIYTGQVGNNWCPQMRLVVSLAAGNADHDLLNWTAYYVAHGYAAYTNGRARAWSINIDGQTQSGSYNINGQTGTVTLGSGQVRVNKQHAYRNIGVSCSMNIDVTWNGAYIGTATASGSQPIGEKQSYTVSYNANGGSGAPGNQTKWYGENLILSSGRPTRTGHNFSGWATSASGAVAYQPGATYTGNGNLALYAKWTPHTYTVSYNANGGTGAPGNQTKTYGQTLKLSTTIPKRTNYNFKGWGTSAGSTSVAYAAGANYTNNSAITLYAVWELAWLQPRITNLKADRCDSAGTLKEDGTYAKVTFNWATDRTISSIKIACNGVTTNASGSGTSGSVSVVVGANALSTEKDYPVNVTVTDAVGGATITTTIASLAYIIDVAPNGGLAFGRPASSKEVNSAMTIAVDKRDNSEAQVIARSAAGRVYLYSQGASDNVVGVYAFNHAGSKSASLVSMNQAGDVKVNSKSVTHAENRNGYWGTQLPNGTATDWYRTTYNGIIPFQPGGASALGTESWPFNDVWTNGLNWTGNGLKGRVMKQIWSGNWSSGSITVPELPYYNVILVRTAIGATSGTSILATRTNYESFIGASGYIESSGNHITVFWADLTSNTVLRSTGSGSNPAVRNEKPVHNFSNPLTVTNIYGLL